MLGEELGSRYEWNDIRSTDGLAGLPLMSWLRMWVRMFVDRSLLWVLVSEQVMI